MKDSEKLHSYSHFTREATKNTILDYNEMKVLGYLALLSLANKYCRTDPRKLNLEIGLIAADLIEPEFAKKDKHNLIARKAFLLNELENIKKLEKLDDYEDHFIKYGKSFALKTSMGPKCFLDIGVPFSTLEAAGII